MHAQVIVDVNGRYFASVVLSGDGDAARGEVATDAIREVLASRDEARFDTPGERIPASSVAGDCERLEELVNSVAERVRPAVSASSTSLSSSSRLPDCALRKNCRSRRVFRFSFLRRRTSGESRRESDGDDMAGNDDDSGAAADISDADDDASTLILRLSRSSSLRNSSSLRGGGRRTLSGYSSDRFLACAALSAASRFWRSSSFSLCVWSTRSFSNTGACALKQLLQRAVSSSRCAGSRASLSCRCRIDKMLCTCLAVSVALASDCSWKCTGPSLSNRSESVSNARV
jgi:hypothetical protein